MCSASLAIYYLISLLVLSLLVLSLVVLSFASKYSSIRQLSTIQLPNYPATQLRKMDIHVPTVFTWHRPGNQW